MNIDRGSLVAALALILLGGMFLVLNLLGWSLGTTWPVVFFVLAVGFYLPPFLWPVQRRGLVGLFIPASIFLTLGLVFLYNTLSGDWIAWAYAWLLLPAGVGLGLVLAAWGGGWGRAVAIVGAWMGATGVALFALFGLLFGTSVLKMIAPLLFILGGLLLLGRGLLKK